MFLVLCKGKAQGVFEKQPAGLLLGEERLKTKGVDGKAGDTGDL